MLIKRMTASDEVVIPLRIEKKSAKINREVLNFIERNSYLTIGN